LSNPREHKIGQPIAQKHSSAIVRAISFFLLSSRFTAPACSPPPVDLFGTAEAEPFQNMIYSEFLSSTLLQISNLSPQRVILTSNLHRVRHIFAASVSIKIPVLFSNASRNGRMKMSIYRDKGDRVGRRTVLYGLGAIAAHSLLAGCGSNIIGHAASAQVSQPVPSGSLTQGSVTVSGSSGRSIGAAFTGLSYEKNSFASQPLFVGTNANMIGLFKRLGTSLLRIGGNTVDTTVWNANGSGETSGEVAPADVNGLAAFLQATGWQCLYGVNLGGAASGATTPALAAAEVAYVVGALGSNLYGIEIGNECDNYSESYYPEGWSLSEFETLWEQFRTAIKTVTSGVVVTGPASSGNISNWTVPFGEYATKQQISLLTQHYYRGNGKSASSTAAELVSVDTALPDVCQQLQVAADKIGIPWRMSETNSFYNGGASGVSNSYASSLWVIDHLATIALNGGAGVNTHGGGNGTGYTPIADNNGVVLEARPEFYGLLMFTLFGQGNLLTTTVSAGDLNVTAYSVQTSSGGVNILLCNKDSTQDVQLSISCGQSVKQATLLEMAAPGLSATSGVTIQGASVNADGSFTPGASYAASQINGEVVTCYLPALSAVLLQIS
jgi:hypothetical protein